MSVGYERYLPELFRTDPFYGRFLKSFEKILSGVNDGVLIDGQPVVGLEDEIDRVSQHFVPDQAPREFLKWLAAWLALSLRDDWDEATQRMLTRRIASFFPRRGTRSGLEELLNLYLQAGAPPGPPAVIASIVEPVAFQVGVHSTVGMDTWVGGGAPHHFTVLVDFQVVTPSSLELKPRAVADIVDREKPAHTYYDLQLLIPTIRVGVRSTVGMDTVLGNKVA
jgi:phage tail-like protein